MIEKTQGVIGELKSRLKNCYICNAATEVVVYVLDDTDKPQPIEFFCPGCGRITLKGNLSDVDGLVEQWNGHMTLNSAAMFITDEINRILGTKKEGD